MIGFIDDNENVHPHPGDTLDTCGPQYSVGDGIEKRGDLFFGKAGDFRNLCDRRAVGQQLFRDLSQSFGLSFGFSFGLALCFPFLDPSVDILGQHICHLFSAQRFSVESFDIQSLCDVVETFGGEASIPAGVLRRILLRTEPSA